MKSLSTRFRPCEYIEEINQIIEGVKSDLGEILKEGLVDRRDIADQLDLTVDTINNLTDCIHCIKELYGYEDA